MIARDVLNEIIELGIGDIARGAIRIGQADRDIIIKKSKAYGMQGVTWGETETQNKVKQRANVIPEERRMSAREELNDIISFTSDQVIMDRVTAYHPKLKQHVLVDPDIIGEMHGHRKGRLVPLESLKARGKEAPGYSLDRERLANMSKPIIVDSENNLVDGRHRVLKMKKKGRLNARAIRITEEDIDRASIIRRLS